MGDAGFRPAQCGRKPAIPWLVVPLLISTAFAQSPAGYVLKLDGSWTVNGKPIKAGDLVHAGDQLDSNPKDATIGLVRYDGTYLKCERGKPQPAACSRPIQIPAEKQTQNIFQAFFARLSNSKLPPIAFVTSRGLGAPPPVKLQDAILVQRGVVADFTDAVSDAPKDTLHLLLEPLELPASCSTLEVKLGPGTRTAGIPDLKPACLGLYQLSSTDESMEAAYPATVLFVAPAQVDRASKMLAEATDRSSQWQNSSEEEKRTFVRVVLSAIRHNL